VFYNTKRNKADLNKQFGMRKGATVTELAAIVNKDLARKMKIARVWGREVYDGQRVAMDYELVDGDVVELND
ncbi:MAG: TGS domain-containing protein, partial [bacterium]